MHSSPKNRLLRALFPDRMLISLSLRTLGVCIFALFSLAIGIYLVLNNQFASNRAKQIDQLLQEKALATYTSAAANKHPYSGTLTPVYFHQGSMLEAQTTEHWPKNCELATTPETSGIYRFKCEAGIDLHAMQTALKANPEIPGQQITFWAFNHADTSFLEMKLGEALSLGILGLIISVFCSRLISRSISLPLNEITASAESLATGEYHDWSFPKSNIREINKLASTFNHMAKSLREWDKIIRRTAYKDQLTGLDNRYYLRAALQERSETAREPLSIVTWGIDNLDSISEVLGHEIADNLLIKVARKIRRVCKDSLAIARLEGNVFCVLLPRFELEEFQRQNNLKHLLNSTMKVHGYLLDIQCHAGVSHYPEHGQCPDTLMRHAEVARQLAKKTRQTCITFEKRLEQRSANRLELIAQLRKAVAEDEFCLFFQPKLNLRTNSINQAEVLLRWNHPTHGLISPGGFIELAEQTGIIRDITRMILKETYSIIGLCAHQNIRLSVNLSAMDLEDNSLIDFISELHHRQPDASRHIALEITESAAMRDPEQALEVLNELAALNFQIAVDDFGTGYSSLAYLKKFPVTELKIDRSLVQGADMDTDGQIILESTIEMGHIMGLLVTTEGVETQAEFDLVKKLGADYVQGFWLSKPMPFDEFKLKHLIGNHDQLVNTLQTT